MEVLAAFALGVARVDVDEETWELVDEPAPVTEVEELGLPLVIATARCGSRVVALLDRRPPLALSDDAGVTWSGAGSGLPPGVAVAISDDHPDDLVYAASERLFVSRDGGRFWAALSPELPGITGVAISGNRSGEG
jgi:hypothetical protein